MTAPDKPDNHTPVPAGTAPERLELARRVVEAQRNDTRTPEEKIADGVKFIMGPGGDEGTRAVTASDREQRAVALAKSWRDRFDDIEDDARILMQHAPKELHGMIEGIRLVAEQQRDSIDAFLGDDHAR